jgi:hypothetical protein
MPPKKGTGSGKKGSAAAGSGAAARAGVGAGAAARKAKSLSIQPRKNQHTLPSIDNAVAAHNILIKNWKPNLKNAIIPNTERFRFGRDLKTDYNRWDVCKDFLRSTLTLTHSEKDSNPFFLSIMQILFGTDGTEPCRGLQTGLDRIEDKVRNEMNITSSVLKIPINYLKKPDGSDYAGGKHQLPPNINEYMYDSGETFLAVNPNMRDYGPASNWTDPAPRNRVNQGNPTFPKVGIPLIIEDAVFERFINHGIFTNVRLIITNDNSCIVLFDIKIPGNPKVYKYGVHIDNYYKSRSLSEFGIKTSDNKDYEDASIFFDPEITQRSGNPAKNYFFNNNKSTREPFLADAKAKGLAYICVKECLGDGFFSFLGAQFNRHGYFLELELDAAVMADDPIANDIIQRNTDTKATTDLPHTNMIGLTSDNMLGAGFNMFGINNLQRVWSDKHEIKYTNGTTKIVGQDTAEGVAYIFSNDPIDNAREAKLRTLNDIIQSNYHIKRR